MSAEEIVAPVVVEPPAPPPAPAQVQMSSEQLKKRLDETRETARKQLMTELGITDVPAAKAALAAPPKDDPERIAALEQKTASQEATITALKAANDAALSERATSELAGLSEIARKAIEESTDKPEERIALAKLVRAAAPPPPVAAVAAPVVPSTSPPRTAPEGGSSSPPARKAEYAYKAGVLEHY